MAIAPVVNPGPFTTKVVRPTKNSITLVVQNILKNTSLG